MKCIYLYLSILRHASLSIHMQTYTLEYVFIHIHVYIYIVWGQGNVDMLFSLLICLTSETMWMHAIPLVQLVSDPEP